MTNDPRRPGRLSVWSLGFRVCLVIGAWCLAFFGMQERGLEPLHLSVREPKSRASANSATPANRPRPDGRNRLNATRAAVSIWADGRGGRGGGGESADN